MQISYTLAPTLTPFDLEAVEARLSALPGAFPHPDPSDRTYVVTAGPEMKRFVASEISVDPYGALYGQGLVTLDPSGIRVHQDAPQAVLAQLRDFVTWVLATYPCSVFSETGDDWTARYARHPQALFEEEPVA
ncbi:MAG TPA: hypothetical protein V6D00_09355 [Pantanalinema sp.]